MSETITATEANREFSRILREVSDGQTYIVTSHGRPVARIVPIDDDRAQRDAAWEALFARLENQPIRKIGPWTRDELYDDDVADEVEE